MEYITIKNFQCLNNEGIPIVIKRDTEVEEVDGLIACGEIPLCNNGDKTAFEYFSRNNDRKGKERAELCWKIVNRLNKVDNKSAVRWKAIYSSDKAKSLRDNTDTVFWKWGYDFYNAEIKDLKTIWSLISAI